ncbi:MAG TPA: hypothetical protein PKZ16_01835 [bacterium]|nr:hypothetical protein [bacterium]HPL95804.1 hypothetical protein [bacterium]
MIDEIKKPNSDWRAEQMRQNLSQVNRPMEREHKIKFKNWWFVGLILVVVLGLAAVIIKTKPMTENKTEWQAIFLADGQVYFGKVTTENSRTIIIKNIYYLQTPGVIQQGGGDNINKQGTEISLIKLGNEVHGPTDEMRINRQQVLFVEDLKDDSKIVKAIKDYINK